MQGALVYPKHNLASLKTPLDYFREVQKMLLPATICNHRANSLFDTQIHIYFVFKFEYQQY